MTRRWVAAALWLAACAAAHAAEQMSVTVKEAPARERPSFTAKIVGTLAYADRVDVVEVRGDWIQVRFAAKSIEGWVPRSALQTQQIVLRSGQAAGTAASSGEVALAGKGFSEEVEAEYRKNAKLNYAAVDDMEAFKASADQVVRFLSAGGLTVAGETP